MATRLGGAAVSIAAALVILGLAAIPFANPFWIHFEQDRVGAAAYTGYTPDGVHQATDGILHDLVFGGDFDVPAPGTVGGAVLDPAERAHMRDVRGVFAGFALAALISAAILVVTAWSVRRRSNPRPAARAWAAVERGLRWLVVLLGVLGVAAVFAFAPAFEIFHQVFFPGGNYNFDPRTEKMVQLFPEQFFSETALAYGAVAIVLALGVGWYAGRRARAGGWSRP